MRDPPPVCPALRGATTLTLLFAAACARPPAADPAYRAEIDAWHQKRIERLRSKTGWLTLVGLPWLKEGANRAGSAPDNEAVFPAGSPARIGVFHRAGDAVRFAPEPGVSVTAGDAPLTGPLEIHTDALQEPTVLKLGTLVFHVIKRGDRLGVRVKDTEARALKEFRGIERFRVDASWHFDARFEPYDPPKTIQVPSILGATTAEKCPGALVFEKDGATHRLDAVEEEPGADELFIIFGDRTNGHDTYGAGRFLYIPVPKNGRAPLDFNRAYNPPCAFTPYATCPLPPPQNRLALRVEAGEKNYGAAH